MTVKRIFNISDQGIALIKRFEGLRLKSYLDPVGVATIGYGHTKGVRLNDPEITEYDANRLLAEDLVLYEKAVNEMVEVSVSQNQFDALISFSFNLGIGALRGSTLLKKLNAGETCSNEFLRWNMAGGKAIPGLARRRQAEKRMFDG